MKIVPFVLGILWLPLLGWQNLKGEPKKIPPLPKGAQKHSANVLRGSIAQISDNALTLHVGGGEETADLTAQTHYWYNRQATTREAFQVGQTVVVHLRRKRGEAHRIVVDLADPKSWQWLQHMRRDVVKSTLLSATEDQLQVQLANSPTAFSYLIEEGNGSRMGTLWGVKGAQVPANPFHSGDTIWIVPRTRADGTVVARAVADTRHLALVLKEELATTLHGKILTVDPTTHSFSLLTSTGERRTFTLTPHENSRSNAKPSQQKPLTETELKPGLWVVVHLRHERDGTITVQSVTLAKATHRRKATQP